MSDSPRQTYRSFTVRVPTPRYVQIAELAKESKSNMNSKVNELLELGLKENVRVESILGRLLRAMDKEEKNGKA